MANGALTVDPAELDAGPGVLTVSPDELDQQGRKKPVPAPQPRLQGPAGPATGISAQPKPTLLERVKHVFTEGIPRYSTAAVNAPGYGREQIITPEAALTPLERRAHPILAGAGEFAGSLSSPENLGFIAATGGLGELGGVAGQTVRRLASAGFTAQMLHSAYQQAPALAKAINDGNYPEAKRLATILTLTAGMGGLAGAHAIGGEARPAIGAKPEAEARPAQTVAPGEQAPKPAPAAPGEAQRAAVPAEPKFTVTPPTPRTLEKIEPSDFQRIAAQRNINLIRNPVRRAYAQDYLRARLEGGTEPDRGPLSAMAARAAQSSVDEKLESQKPVAPAEKFSPDVLEEARDELAAAHDLWSSLPPPGRFEAVAGRPFTTEEKGAGYYGITSPRPAVEQMHPWVADSPDVTLAKLSDAVKRGKGADYDRILSRAAGYIEAQRQEAAPIIAEFSPSLTNLAALIRDTEPELAGTLTDLAAGKVSGIRDVRRYINEKITDATEAANLKAALAELDRAAAGESVPSGAQEPAGATGGAREPEGVLPGLEPAVAEQRTAAERFRGEELARQFARPPESIEQGAGEMERGAPLFRGTEASPQAEMFSGLERELYEKEPRATKVTTPGGAQITVGSRANSEAIRQGERRAVELGLVRQDQIPALRSRALDSWQSAGRPGMAFEDYYAALLRREGLTERRAESASPQREIFAAGPGTPAVGQTDITAAPLRQLSDSVGRVTRVEQAPTERISTATKLADAAMQGRSGIDRAVARMKTVGAAMADLYRRPPQIDDYQRLKGDYTLAQQKSALELGRFSKEMVRAIPDPRRRAAMGVWVEAAGNEQTLLDWAERSKPAEAAKYIAATRLTDAEKTIARNIQNFQDERAQAAIDQGIMQHALENYLYHAWHRVSDYTRSVVNTIRTEMLQPNPRFAKRRIFPTIFDGEQAGFKARSTDIGLLAAAHEHALNEAIAARAFIKSLLDGKAKDGRPIAAVSGSGVPIRAEDTNEAYLIRSHSLKQDVRDYRPIDHPALRRWKWAASDAEGKPIYVQGDIVIHPDFYPDLKNVLTRSALRAWTIPGTDIRPGAAALRLSQEFKNTLLAFAGFHQVQTGLHGLEHRINPSKLVELDLDEPRQAGLVRGGLTVASYDAEDRFAEGLASGGLVEKIPGIGPKLAQYRDYLFQSYIPRLKMTMGLAALARNEARYSGELTREQIFKLTAQQANAAFGEQNLLMMGRNRTLQDVLRLALLAPDFLESRTRFVAQALKPYGREQLEALALGAVALYVGARITNQLLTGNARWAPQDAFTVTDGKRAYVLRTIQGDLAHLLTDPRSFVYNRLNPLYGRGGVELLTGRDKYGRKRAIGEEARDIARGGIPIALQGYLKSTPSTLVETFLTSMGVGSFQYRTPAAKLAHQFVLDSIPQADESPEQVSAGRLKSRLVEEIRLGKATQDDLARAHREGRISRQQYHAATQELKLTPLQAEVKRLSAWQALQVWKVASPTERQELAPIMRRKQQRLANAAPVERRELIGRIRAALGQ